MADHKFSSIDHGEGFYFRFRFIEGFLQLTNLFVYASTFIFPFIRHTPSPQSSATITPPFLTLPPFSWALVGTGGLASYEALLYFSPPKK